MDGIFLLRRLLHHIMHQTHDSIYFFDFIIEEKMDSEKEGFVEVKFFSQLKYRTRIYPRRHGSEIYGKWFK